MQGGHTVTIFTTNALDLDYFWIAQARHLQPSKELYNGTTIERFQIDHKVWMRRSARLLGMVPYWRLQALFKAPSFWTFGLERALIDFRPHVIHVGPLPYNALIYSGARAAEKVGARLLVTPCTHFGVDGSRDVAKHYTANFQIRLLNECEKILVLTETEGRKLQVLGAESKKIVFSGIGIRPDDVCGGDPAVFGDPSGEQKIVLHLGMKAPEKGTITLVRAIQYLWQKRVRVRLILAGGSLRSFEEYLCKQRIPDGCLLDLSHVTDEQKRHLFAAADVVVQPSSVESFGLVCLEAWANSKPVIAADLAVTREIIANGKDGILVEFGDHLALASSIERVLTDEHMARRLGASGKTKLFAKYQWDNIAPKLVTLISKANSLASENCSAESR